MRGTSHAQLFPGASNRTCIMVFAPENLHVLFDDAKVERAVPADHRNPKLLGLSQSEQLVPSAPNRGELGISEMLHRTVTVNSRHHP